MASMDIHAMHPEFRRPPSDFLAFWRISSILDMALAAAEAAAALEAETGSTSDAVVAAREFFQRVRYGMAREEGAGTTGRINVGGSSEFWDAKHSQCLRQAEEVWDALAADGIGSTSERFREHHDRLAQRIHDGLVFEAEHAL